MKDMLMFLSVVGLINVFWVSTNVVADDHCDTHHYQQCPTQLGLYVTGQLGIADSDTSDRSLNQLYNVQGVNASSVSIDEKDTAGSLGFGYQFTPNWAIEATYLDLGERNVTFSGTTLDPVSFVEAAKSVYPETAEGVTLGVVYSHILSEKLKVAGKLGIFDWDNRYETQLNVGNNAKVYVEGTHAWYGAELQYRYSHRMQLFLSLAQYELRNSDNQLLSGGLRYYIDAHKPSRPAKPAPVPMVVQKPVDTDGDGIYDMQDQCPDTPIKHTVDSMGCTVMAEQFVDYALVIRFERNSDVIADSYKADLNEMVNFINKYGVKVLTVYGHTSAVGSASYNQMLSQKRAESLRSRLLNEYGVDTDIKAVGKGESELLDDANTAEAHAKNRRVELAIRERLVAPVLKQ